MGIGESELNKPNQNPHFGQNRTELELIMPKYVELEPKRSHKCEEPEANQNHVVWVLAGLAKSLTRRLANI